MQPKYQCSKCKLAVLVTADAVIRGCACNAPIVANMQATVRGATSMGNGRV